jgi:nitrite reductase/ring-hydroxylating ferredoxin subunit
MKGMPLVPSKLLADVPPGSMAEFETADATYAICNVDGVIHCVDGICPHAGGPLAEGALHGSTIVCPWHSWEFDVCTGAGGDSALKTFPVTIESGRIFIQVP